MFQTFLKVNFVSRWEGNSPKIESIQSMVTVCYSTAKLEFAQKEAARLLRAFLFCNTFTRSRVMTIQENAASNCSYLL